jgi:hypothetical protein
MATFHAGGSFIDESGIFGKCGAELFIGNAYRILDLPGNARMAAVSHARESLLQSLQSSVKPERTWNLPWLGDAGWTESDIDDAFERLRNPAQRLVNRLCWFNHQREILAQLTPATLLLVAANWATSPDPEVQHDAALLYLIKAQLDADFTLEPGWPRAIALWRQVQASESYWRGFTVTELAGDFPVKASLNTVYEMRQQLLAFVAAGITNAIERAEAANNAAAIRRGRDLLESLASPADLPPASVLMNGDPPPASEEEPLTYAGAPSHPLPEDTGGASRYLGRQFVCCRRARGYAGGRHPC